MNTVPPFGLRMTFEIKQELETAAKKNGRSLNSEILARLEWSMGRYLSPNDPAPTSPPDEEFQDAVEIWIRGFKDQMERLEGRVKSLEAKQASNSGLS